MKAFGKFLVTGVGFLAGGPVGAAAAFGAVKAWEEFGSNDSEPQSNDPESNDPVQAQPDGVGSAPEASEPAPSEGQGNYVGSDEMRLERLYHLFTLLSKVAMADGSISTQESDFLSSFDFDEEAKEFVSKVIEDSRKDASKSLIQCTQDFKNWSGGNWQETEWLLKQLVGIAIAEEKINPQERAALETIVGELDLPAGTLDNCIEQVQIQKIIVNSDTRGFGSGFFITEDGYLITNEHVVKDSENIIVRTQSELLQAQVLKIDAEEDLALLKVETHDQPFAKLIDSEPYEGQKVFTMGYPVPETLGFEMKLTSGVVSSITGYEDDPRQVQFDATIMGGNSGGPLFCDETGYVIGVNSSGITMSFHEQVNSTGLVNYARKAERIKIFLKDFAGLQLPINSILLSFPVRKRIIDHAKDCTVQIFTGSDRAQRLSAKVDLRMKSMKNSAANASFSKDSKIHLSRGGKIHGPYSRTKLEEYLNDEMVSLNDWAWIPGTYWRSLEEILSLMDKDSFC